MKSDHGDVFSDFEIKLEATPGSVLEGVRLGTAVYGTINGGGPDMQFTTLNGRIYIRKKK